MVYLISQKNKLQQAYKIENETTNKIIKCCTSVHNWSFSAFKTNRKDSVPSRHLYQGNIKSEEPYVIVVIWSAFLYRLCSVLCVCVYECMCAEKVIINLNKLCKESTTQ